PRPPLLARFFLSFLFSYLCPFHPSLPCFAAVRARIHPYHFHHQHFHGYTNAMATSVPLLPSAPPVSISVSSSVSTPATLSPSSMPSLFRAEALLQSASPVAVSAKPAYCTPSPVENTPQNNECRMVEVRGAKLASFTVNGRELICLPQAFELFLKHLVGGLHTVYTKLKRLEITPVVCNVEQVRVLRGLGAIQPGVNRCKLISRKDFETLYNDCTNASSRPGRPPKRTQSVTSPDSPHVLPHSVSGLMSSGMMSHTGESSFGLTAATLAEAMKKKIKMEVMSSYHGSNNHGGDSENGDINSSIGDPSLAVARRCPQDAVGWLVGLVVYSQSSSDTGVSSSAAVSDPLTPAQHTLTQRHHVSVAAVLRMIYHPQYLLYGGPLGVLTIEEQRNIVLHKQFSLLEYPHTVPADFVVVVKVECHQAFWSCDNKPFFLVLTTVPSHTDSLVVSTKTKAGLATEDGLELPFMMMSHPLIPVSLPPASVTMAMSQMNHLSTIANMAAAAHAQSETSRMVTSVIKERVPDSPSPSPSLDDGRRSGSHMSSRQSSSVSSSPAHTESSSDRPHVHQNGLSLGHALLGLSPSAPPGPKEGDLATQDTSHDTRRTHIEKEESMLCTPTSRESYERVSHAGPALPPGFAAPLLFPEGLSSIETLLTNIQGLLKVAIDNARAQEKQVQLEKTELKMELYRERELRETLERQLCVEQKNRVAKVLLGCQNGANPVVFFQVVTKHPVGSVLWAASCGQCPLGNVLWAASCGQRPLGNVLWAASCGQCPVGSVLWAASCGQCPVGSVLWAVSFGQRPVGSILWAAPFGQRPVGSVLWAASCGQCPVGSVLWAASCRQHPVGSVLWAASCGQHPVGSVLWAASCGQPLIQKRLKKEKKTKRKLQEALEYESKRRDQAEQTLQQTSTSERARTPNEPPTQEMETDLSNDRTDAERTIQDGRLFLKSAVMF
ncbi:hypothetical protein NFI96_015954, partial [Prochilodus magdalenae]